MSARASDGDWKTNDLVLAAASCARIWCLLGLWAECTAPGASTLAICAPSPQPVPRHRQRHDVPNLPSLPLTLCDLKSLTSLCASKSLRM
jgi:hypothetical protein